MSVWLAGQVGNFRVEPPGLFRGRGEHPKMGKFKRRIYPKDITINIGSFPLHSLSIHRISSSAWALLQAKDAVSILPITFQQISSIHLNLSKAKHHNGLNISVIGACQF